MSVRFCKNCDKRMQFQKDKFGFWKGVGSILFFGLPFIKWAYSPERCIGCGLTHRQSRRDRDYIDNRRKSRIKYLKFVGICMILLLALSLFIDTDERYSEKQSKQSATSAIEEKLPGNPKDQQDIPIQTSKNSKDIGSSKINVYMTVKSNDSDMPMIYGTTNLPDGTELMISVERRENSYRAQYKIAVTNGQFRAGPFLQFENQLNPGIYTLLVMTPCASFQPKSVQTLLGQKGINLIGSLVLNSDICGSVVKYVSHFSVGSGKSSVSQDRAAKNKTKQEWEEWRDQERRETTTSELDSPEIRRLKKAQWELALKIFESQVGR